MDDFPVVHGVFMSMKTAMKTNPIAGWGRYPLIDAAITCIRGERDATELLEAGSPVLARGLGRSYGDASLAEQVADMTGLNRFLSFDEKTGILSCEAGVSLDEIIHAFVPRGWFLPVTPGTRFVTVGGAVAADVHGKNHHVAGSFCSHVTSLKLLDAAGNVKNCSPLENEWLFRATCGGNGLTGFILSADIRLIRVESAWIRQTAVKAGTLEELVDLFDRFSGSTYSVAWIDCLSSGTSMGRGILLTGEHALADEIRKEADNGNPLALGRRLQVSVPISLPPFTINRLSARAFNTVYYHKFPGTECTSLIRLFPFFYPLDAVQHWNRVYGRRGFIQYQFVLPKSAGLEGFRGIFKKIVDSGAGSFLAVLKAFGKQNANYLSFPMEGLTLALDFPLSRKVLDMLQVLDEEVLELGGRHYLAKDSRMMANVFHRGYGTGLKQFRSVKEKVDPGNRFRSLQSERLEVVI